MSSPMPASYRKPSQALAGGARLSLAPRPCDLLLCTRNFHVYICLPRRRNSGQIRWSPLSAQHATWCPAGSPEEERMDGWMGPAPSKPPAIFLPLTSQPVQPDVCLISLSWESRHVAEGHRPHPQTHSSPEPGGDGRPGGEGLTPSGTQNSAHTTLRALKFHHLIDVFQASHLSGVTRQRGLFLPPARLREDPGSVSTLAGVPEGWSSGDSGDPAWPLPSCVTLSRPFPHPGLRFPI